MAQNITISRTAGTRALLTALFAVTVLLIARMAENVLTGLKTARLLAVLFEHLGKEVLCLVPSCIVEHIAMPGKILLVVAYVE